MRVYPEIILSAKQNELSVNAFRAWFLAKDYCGGKRGAVPVKGFRQYLKNLGIPRATYSRWIKDACDLKLLIRHHSDRTGLDYYLIAGWVKGAELAGCEHLDRPVDIEPGEFAGRSWISLTWAAYELRFKDMPVSRATLEKLTGVPERTQQYREKRAHVQQKANIAIHGDYNELAHKDPVRVIAAYEIPGMFKNKTTGELCQQLPNSREVPAAIQPAPIGRTRKTNKLLRALLNRDAEADPQQPFIRRYSNNQKQTQAIKAKLRKLQIPGAMTIYERWKALPGGMQGWAVCNV